MRKILKRSIALLLAISLVCGLAPNLSLVAKAEEKVPIIVIPGIMGSKLYSNRECTNAVWGDVLSVLLASIKKTGQKLAISNTLYAKGLTLAEDEEYGTIEAYEDLLTLLNDRYPDRDVYLFSYDWRQSNVESAKVLAQALEEKGIKKADFLCHSMGGLVMSQFVNQKGQDAIKHVITLGSPQEGATKLLQAVLTNNILTGEVAIGNELLYKSGLTASVKAGLLGVGELSPTLEYWNGRINGVVEGISVGSGVQARAIYTYQDVLQRIFGSKFEQVINAQNSCQAGVDTLLGMDDVYFAIGYNQKTMSGARILVNIDKPADSIESIVFYDCEYETMGDNTVPFHSANMMQISNPENAAYFKLGHDELSGNDASGSEWEREKQWLFSILEDREIDRSVTEMTPDKKPYTVVRVNAPMEAEVEYGGEVLSSEDYSDETQFGVMNLMGINSEIKMFCIDSGKDYKVTLDGESDGILEFAIRFYDGDGNMYQERMVTDVAVTGSTVIRTGTDEKKDTILEIDYDGNGSVDSTVTVNGGGSADEPEQEEHKHTFGEPEFVWSEDLKSCTATFVCKDNDISQEVVAEITEEVTEEATVEKEGTLTYTATLEFEGEVYTDIKTISIPLKEMSKVTGFEASNQTTSVKLVWNQNEEADGYIIYRRTKDTSYEEMARIEDAETIAFTDKTVSAGTKYYYNIAAYKNVGDEINLSAKRSKATQILHTRITSISNDDGSVKVTWSKAKDVDGYKVYRKATGQESYSCLKTIKDADTNYYVDKKEKTIVNGRKSQYYILPYYEDADNVTTKSATKTNYYLKRQKITSLSTSGSKKLKVTWAKNNSASGYQIRYSTSKSFDKYSSAEITSAGTTSKTLKDLKKNKTYYVKMRTYKTVNGTKYYSKWSAVKSKKVK